MSLKAPKGAQELLSMYFLEARCHLLETAAIFDRIERAEGAEKVKQDVRYKTLLNSFDILKNSGRDRAKTFQLLFSETD